MNYREGYEWGRSMLEQAGVTEAALDARYLLEHVCGTNRNDLLVHGDRPLESGQEQKYRKLIGLRADRIPLQHLTGVQEFMGLEFQVNEHVLIPRQDTEILVEEVLKELHDGMRILDMCTGSGCILISLLHYSNDCSGIGVDISEKALTVAEKNAERLLDNSVAKHVCVEEVGGPEEATKEIGQIKFLQSDLFEKVTGKYEFIVSNPPYIRSDVIPTLMPEVKEHEPMLALDGTEDGLYFYRRIAEEGKAFLAKGGRLYFEIGYDQAEAVSEIMASAGYREIRTVKDFAGLDRVVCGIHM